MSSETQNSKYYQWHKTNTYLMKRGKSPLRHFKTICHKRKFHRCHPGKKSRVPGVCHSAHFSVQRTHLTWGGVGACFSFRWLWWRMSIRQIQCTLKVTFKLKLNCDHANDTNITLALNHTMLTFFTNTLTRLSSNLNTYTPLRFQWPANHFP